MNTGVTHFKTGNTFAKLKAGKQHKSTILKEKIGLKNLQELEADLLQGWFELLHSKNNGDKRFALKEISRYVFAVKKEVSHTGTTFEDFIKSLNEKEEEKNNFLTTELNEKNRIE